jgi:hypothetical protein
MTEEPDPELEPTWLERLYELNAVIASTGEPLEGNLFYFNRADDFADRPPDPGHRAKRDRFREAVSSRERMLEVGVNGAHAAFLALSSNPRLSYHGVDVCRHGYVIPAVEWLAAEFPGRVTFTQGSSLSVLPELGRQRLDFDAFHVDGHKPFYYKDIVNCSRMASRSGALIIVDDIHRGDVATAWAWCSRLRVVKPAPHFPPMDRSTSRSTNEIGQLIPSSWVKWRTLRSSSRALGLLARGRGLQVRSQRWIRRRTEYRAGAS